MTTPANLRSVAASCLVALLLSVPVAFAAGPGAALDAITGTPPAAADADAASATPTEDDAATADLRAQRQALLEEAAAAPTRIRELERQLAQSPSQTLAEWQVRLPEDADVETLEDLLERERLTINQLRSQIDARTQDLSEALSRPVDSALQSADRARRLDALAAPLLPGEGESTDAVDQRRARNAAEIRRLQAEQDLEATRQDVAGARQRVQELELRVLRNQLAQHEPREAVLQRRIAAVGRRDLQRLVDSLDEQAAALATGPALVAETAAENRDLGEEMREVNEALASDRALLADQDAGLERDLSALRNSRTRLDLGGQSEQVGIWLWAELRRLEPQRRLQQRIDETHDQLAELRLRLIGLDEMQRELADLPQAVSTLRAAHSSQQDEATPDGTQATADPLEDLLRQRLELSERLEPLLWRRVAALEDVERSLQARLDANRQLRDMLDRHLLWIRSHAPVDAAWFASLPDGFHDLVKPSRFVTTAGLLRESFAANATPYIASVAAVVLLVLMRVRAKKRLEPLGQIIRDVRQDSYRRTLESFAWTLLGALPAPAALFLAGRLLQGIGTSGKYSDSLGQALVATSLPLLTLMFLWWLVRERGLAHAHFRWTRPRREAIRRWLPWFAAVLVPLFFVVSLAFARNQELAASVQARIAVVLVSLVWAVSIAWLLAPERMWHSRTGAGEPARWRQLLRVLLPLGSLVAAWLALDGYVYTVAILQDSLFASIGVFTAVAVVHGLLSRWFVLGERRLAMKRYLEKAKADDAAAEDGGESVPVELQEEIALEKVNAHSRAMLRVVKVTLLTLGLVTIWGSVILALFRFDEVPLWTVAGKAADGTAVPEQITLLAVMLGIAVLWLTVAAARNLPGLLEIGLLSRAGVDAASRYAITSVARYAILAIGIIIGLGLIGLRWGQLQWMAAALTVGLGFGLQEIFANFVSGLILLFERPFRVGDTITVNNLDGTVTRIRTRATTILDFDNKEIVVPNKAFITGQLVNWTLSDETTRVVIKVGVDYGNDVELVHRLLVQAAEENPRVLKERPARSWLMGMGASSLDFELRVFVGSMGDRLPVRDEIIARVLVLFDENDITLPSPQLDVHVRDLPVPPSATGDATTPAGAAAPPAPRNDAKPGAPRTR